MGRPPTMAARGSVRRGFTMFELLVVVGIMAICMGMIVAATTRKDERRAQVQAAAAELAATLRQARAFAMERNIVSAVSFNIQNAPGSSGWTLNNRSGGHWYQVSGPSLSRRNSQYNYDSHFPFPRSRYFGSTGTFKGGNAIDSPFRYFLEAMDGSWHGDRHVLAKGKVRFLAIGDQDNGARARDSDLYQPAGGNLFYPRPWFGRWDAANKRLHPWGGYNPAAKDFVTTVRTWADGVTPASCSAFFYEGRDGLITGSVNPADRGILDDTNDDFLFTQAGAMADDQTKTFPLYKKGEPRPVIDGRWLDLFVIFNPDGSVYWGPPLSGRREWGEGVTGGLYNQGFGTFKQADGNLHLIGPGERLGHLSTMSVRRMYEISNYFDHTGAYFITLAPDVPAANADADAGRFASPEAAIASMLPMCRVYITPGGEVGWFEVRKAAPAGTVFNSAVSAASWTNATFLAGSYGDGELRDSTSFKPLGHAITDFLVPEMLTGANWWLQ